MVDLPQPDSPTTPSVSPAFKVKLTPSTALINTFSLENGEHIALYAASAVLSFIVLVLFPFYLYLVLSRDDLSVFACLTHAIKLIRGNILRVIYINVSFIGMLVLCVLSLGIGLLWVEPYYEQTFTNLFLDVTGELPTVDCAV